MAVAMKNMPVTPAQAILFEKSSHHVEVNDQDTDTLPDEALLQISQRLITKNREAYEVLAQ